MPKLWALCRHSSTGYRTCIYAKRLSAEWVQYSRHHLLNHFLSHRHHLSRCARESVPNVLPAPAVHSVHRRPHFLLGLAPVQQLIEQVSCGGLSRLPHRVNSMLHQALTTMFLLPWQNVPDSNQVSKTFKASSLQDRPQASISTKLYTSVCSCTVYSKWLYFAVCQFNIQGGQNYDDSEFLSLINQWG